ncbi:MAG TPA: enoyl-CoA hydratase-related protein, partial [Gemmataceae bacterium]|nr:enoyl-CoA hydratase-related protein [Gemmataceae bacterium]
MSDKLVLYEVDATGTAVLTLNRADKRNALSRALIDAIGESFTRAASDAAVRSVILTGAGSVFCAGMDLAEL